MGLLISLLLLALCHGSREDWSRVRPREETAISGRWISCGSVLPAMEAELCWQRRPPSLVNIKLHGKRRCPCTTNHHASIKAAGGWDPWRSALALWLRLEAKSERALGPGATFGILRMGSPDLPAYGPQRGPTSGPVQPIFTGKPSRPSRGAKPRGEDDTRPPQGRPHQAGSRGGGEIKARGTSRGDHDASHDEQDHTGTRQAPACAVSSFPLWC